MMKKACSKAPESTMVVVVAPYLESARNSVRDSHRVEEKADTKALQTVPLSFRMEIPPSNKAVPLHFGGWALMDADSADRNIWRNCQLLRDRGTRELIAWEPERNYVVPVAVKDSLPSTSAAHRTQYITVKHVFSIFFPGAEQCAAKSQGAHCLSSRSRPSSWLARASPALCCLHAWLVSAQCQRRR